MYSKELETFLIVAKEGSFSRAAEKLFLSVPSVIQQINILEGKVNAKLFIRSKKGVQLSAQGIVFEPYAKKIIALCKEAYSKVENSTIKFLLGTSQLFRPKITQHYWQSISRKFPEIVLQLKALESSEVDIIEAVKLNTFFTSGYEYMEICKVPIGIGVPEKSELAQKDILSWSDLSGQQSLLIEPHISDDSDRLRNEIKCSHPEIQILNTNNYDYVNLDYAQMNGELIILPGIWTSLCPGYTVKPVDWSFEHSYGYFYKRQVHPRILQVLQSIVSAAQSERRLG